MKLTKKEFRQLKKWLEELKFEITTFDKPFKKKKRTLEDLEKLTKKEIEKEWLGYTKPSVSVIEIEGKKILIAMTNDFTTEGFINYLYENRD